MFIINILDKVVKTRSTEYELHVNVKARKNKLLENFHVFLIELQVL